MAELLYAVYLQDESGVQQAVGLSAEKAVALVRRILIDDQRVQERGSIMVTRWQPAGGGDA